MKSFNIIKKLNNKKGISLSELLVCMLIMSLVIAFVSTTLGLVYNLYEESMFESDSSILISTVETSLYDMLRYSEDVSVDVDGNVTAFDSVQTYTVSGGAIEYYKYGITGGNVYLDSSDKTLKYYRNSNGVSYSSGSAIVPTDSAISLVNSGLYSDVKVDSFSLTYDSTTRIYHCSITVTNKKGDFDKTVDNIYISKLSAN